MADRVWKEISYSNLKSNLEIIKKITGTKKIICVVKDDAYGHGSVNISSIISRDDRVGGFAVSTIAEANIIKVNGMQKDIIIISLIGRDSYFEAIMNDYVITVSSYDQVKELSLIAKNDDKIVRVELAIDSGMGRIGFDIDDKIVDTIRDISKLENVSIYGIHSHFAVADSDANDIENVNYTLDQERKFNELIDKLQNEGINVGDISISNSAGILTNKGEKCTAVRPGIILYGLVPNKQFLGKGFKPIMSLKSKIACIREVKPNTSISYGRTYVTDKAMRIATISCGYGDGYPRSASNKACVLINDKKCKIIGRVTMDAMMVDVTGVDCKVDDEVILYGESKTNKITIDDICDITGEFSYELLTRINFRVEKVYVD